MAKMTAVELLDQQEWLGTLSNAVQPVIREFLQGLGPAKDALHGKWLGHPVHPALTGVPVGAWTSALVLDALGLEKAADAAVLIGLAGAVGAAVTGLTDWSETDGRARRIGAMHGMLNVAAAGLYTASIVQRMSGARRGGVSLSMIGYAIASISAYLGGHLVFGEQVGVDHTATSDAGKPDKWTAVLPAADLKKLQRVEIDGIAILLVRKDEQVYALTETCTHMGGPLAEGKLEGDGIRCPWHGSRFCIEDGSVLDGPATFPARKYLVRVRDGQIEIRAAR